MHDSSVPRENGTVSCREKKMDIGRSLGTPIIIKTSRWSESFIKIQQNSLSMLLSIGNRVALSLSITCSLYKRPHGEKGQKTKGRKDRDLSTPDTG